MAEILSQKEIEALLNTAANADSQAPAADAKVKGAEVRAKKHFKGFEERPKRFEFRYHSPVVKQQRIILNPSVVTEVHPGQVVVRTLGNYQQYLLGQYQLENEVPRKRGNGNGNGHT